mgnify:CR=1 FL=1
MQLYKLFVEFLSQNGRNYWITKSNNLGITVLWLKNKIFFVKRKKSLEKGTDTVVYGI